MNLGATENHCDIIYLGESFSSIINALTKAGNQQRCMIDIWDGGSLLSGVDLGGFCVDRVPILVDRPIDIKSILTEGYVEYVRFKPYVEFLGSEVQYENKVSKGVKLQRNWFLELSSGGYLPKKFWCNIFRDMRKVIIAKRYYGGVRKINLRDKLVIVSNEREVLTYGKLVISLPLPYVLNKLGVKVSDGFKYVSLFINIFLVGNYVGESRVIYVGKSHVVPHTIIAINLGDLNEELGNYTLLYVVSSVKHPYVDIKGEFFERIIVDIKRLGVVDVSSIKAYRVLMEKYGLLGTLGDEVIDTHNMLRGYDAVLLGRLSLWREVGINDILVHTQA